MMVSQHESRWHHAISTLLTAHTMWLWGGKEDRYWIKAGVMKGEHSVGWQHVTPMTTCQLEDRKCFWKKEFNLSCSQDPHPFCPLQGVLLITTPGHLWGGCNCKYNTVETLEKLETWAKIPNLHDPGKKAADVSEDGEHEGDPDDAEEKAEDATSDRLRRHVPVTDRCDDREGEKASLIRFISTYKDKSFSP